MKLVLLDAFCKAGGAGVGYHRAGFEVVGVDIDPQPNYPFEFVRADALEVLADRKFLSRFQAVHASPPCQRYSTISKAHNGNPSAHPDLVGPVRELLLKSGLSWVIENVVGSPLERPILLCGTMFSGLRVTRHRLFESSFPIPILEHGPHPLHYTRDKRKPHYGILDEWTAFVSVHGGGNCTRAAAADAMGIDWPMTKDELNNAIPPAYSEHIGKFLIAHLREPKKP